MNARPPRAPRALAVLVAALALASLAHAARAQSGYFASIAYSQSTGRVGFSARQSQTKAGADALAIRMCAAPDAKVFMWARDQWVACAVVDGHVGNAGFGRGATDEEAQTKALAEAAKRAHNNGYRVVLSVHSSGRRAPQEQLRRVAAKPVKSRTGFFAALAYSPSTGKIGATAGKAKTLDDAKQLALKDCDAPDAKVFMWADAWVAIAIAPEKLGVAGFGHGDTRDAAEKMAVEQATKYAQGAKVEIERAIYATGEEHPAALPAAAAVVPASSTTPAQPAPQRTPATPAAPR